MARCRGCLTVNPPRKRKCGACGRALPKKRKPKHLAALETYTYIDYVELSGGENCGICDRAPSGTRRLHRDHDHRTGKPRGLLCFRCNAALRSYMTLDWLRAAVRYLERTAA